MTPSATRAMYKRMMDRNGETIAIRRFSGPAGPNRASSDFEVVSRVSEFHADELVGQAVQGDRKVIMRAEDLINGGFSLPVTTNDFLVVRGKQLRIKAVDDSTRRVKGELIALEIVAGGS